MMLMTDTIWNSFVNPSVSLRLIINCRPLFGIYIMMNIYQIYKEFSCEGVSFIISPFL